jgi:dihydropteroate synthase
MNHLSLNCKGKLLSVEQPIVMAILNGTPDSFYDGGIPKTESEILKKVEKFIHEGATIIDIGAASTRAQACEVSIDEELKRALPIIESIQAHFPDVILSIDTYNSKVANEAVQAGVSIINDISGGTHDVQIFQIAKKYDCPIILMHHLGNMQTMHQQTHYDSILTDIFKFFVQQIHIAEKIGIKDVLIDVGFGFSKTIEQNYTLLKNLSFFMQLNKPILVGLSRKSMLYKLLNTTPEHALNATSIVNTIALQHGASILRVHDVKEAMECVEIYQQLT